MHKKRSNGSENKTDKKNSSSQKIVGQVSNTTPKWFGIRAKKQHQQNGQSQNGQKQRQLAGPSIANPTLKEDSQHLGTKMITNGIKSLE